MTGYVKLVSNDFDKARLKLSPLQPDVRSLKLEFKEHDVYKELKLRGYNYR